MHRKYISIVERESEEICFGQYLFNNFFLPIEFMLDIEGQAVVHQIYCTSISIIIDNDNDNVSFLEG